MHDGDHPLREGDVLSFPRGTEGGHEIRNDGSETARVLVVSTNADPDVAEYPETGKVAYVVGGVHHYHRAANAVEHAFPEETIHVRIGDGWRPVLAAHVGDGMYCVTEQRPADESWEFDTGSIVRVEEREGKRVAVQLPSSG
jgi:hypothetical protein